MKSLFSPALGINMQNLLINSKIIYLEALKFRSSKHATFLPVSLDCCRLTTLSSFPLPTRSQGPAPLVGQWGVKFVLKDKTNKQTNKRNVGVVEANFPFKEFDGKQRHMKIV